MLAEIFILQLETTLRANNEEFTHAPKFVPFDWTKPRGDVRFRLLRAEHAAAGMNERGAARPAAMRRTLSP
jgi:hypothetical protein